MIKLSDADLIAMAIKVAHSVYVLENLPEDEPQESFDTIYSHMLNACAAILNTAVAKYKQDNPESELEPEEILHILSCSSCRAGLTHSNKTRH